jgi:hypothetical protein
VLVWRAEGARATRWRQSVDRRWELEPATKAVITLLLLRGPQTPGELRSRSDRAARVRKRRRRRGGAREARRSAEPLVRELARAPGQKEARWAHLLAGEPPAGELAPRDRRPGSTRSPPKRPDLAARVSALEDRLAEVEARLRDLGGREPRSATEPADARSAVLAPPAVRLHHRLPLSVSAAHARLAPLLVWWKWRACGARSAERELRSRARFWMPHLRHQLRGRRRHRLPMEFQFGTNWARFSRFAGG